MCTLVVATHAWESTPLWVAANRDEQLARPALPPHLWSRDDEEPIFAPRDLRAGGTWLGVRGASLLVAITNRWTSAPPSAAHRSRGQLVLDALAAADAEQAARRVAAVDPATHAPFHLLMADRRGAYLVWNDGRRHHHEPLAPGLHVISERSRGAAQAGRDARLRGQLDALRAEPPTPERWRALMSEHAEPARDGPCVHADRDGYGTRCSTLIRLPAGPGIEMLHADGRPCETEYEDLSAAAMASA